MPPVVPFPEPVGEAFVITQIGEAGSPERARADDVLEYVVRPSLDAVQLATYRADLDPTPGPVTSTLIKRLLDARVIIADVTGRNPNVYYEIGIAHAFGRPLIMLASDVTDLPFDNKDERVIVLGGAAHALAIRDAERARGELGRALSLVLASSYAPNNPVRQAAGVRSLDALAPSDPVAAELAALRDQVEDVYNMLRSNREVPALRRRTPPAEPRVLAPVDFTVHASGRELRLKDLIDRSIVVRHSAQEAGIDTSNLDTSLAALDRARLDFATKLGQPDEDPAEDESDRALVERAVALAIVAHDAAVEAVVAELEGMLAQRARLHESGSDEQETDATDGATQRTPE